MMLRGLAFWLVCDQCGETAPPVLREVEVTRRAASVGWRLQEGAGKEMHLCLGCAIRADRPGAGGPR